MVVEGAAGEGEVGGQAAASVEVGGADAGRDGAGAREAATTAKVIGSARDIAVAT